MSLHEPNRPTTNNHVRQFLDRFAREARDTGQSALPFAEYITREGDKVSVTPAGKKLASSPF
jgi:hypothetical protein